MIFERFRARQSFSEIATLDDAALLKHMTKRMILTRMLCSLKGMAQKELYHRALAVVDCILMLNPDTPSDLRDRGLLYMQTRVFFPTLWPIWKRITPVQ